MVSALIDNFDQLLKYKRKGLIFNGFNESNISFKPTYRILVCFTKENNYLNINFILDWKWRL